MAKGEGRYYPKKAAAIAAAKSLQAEGVRNIDVDCMQINLMHHKKAFPSIKPAFDPAINVAYGAKYLAALHRETSFWFTAVKRYHSARPKFHLPYRGRVFRIWRNIKTKHLERHARRPTKEYELTNHSKSISVEIDLLGSRLGNSGSNNHQRKSWHSAYERARAALEVYKERKSRLLSLRFSLGGLIRPRQLAWNLHDG